MTEFNKNEIKKINIEKSSLPEIKKHYGELIGNNYALDNVLGYGRIHSIGNKSNQGQMASILEKAKRNYVALSGDIENKEEDRHTSMIFAQINALKIQDKKIIDKHHDQTIFCFAFRGRNLFNSIVVPDTILYSMFTLPDAEVNNLVNAFIKYPELSFELFNEVRRNDTVKYIQNHNGDRANIDPGTYLKILPNINYGGTISQPLKSNPFPQGYVPNR